MIQNTLRLFIGSSAKQSGHSLHGGFLDRCTVSFSGKVYKAQYYDSHNKISYPSSQTSISGASNITNANLDSISSDPIRICFCKMNILIATTSLLFSMSKDEMNSMCHLSQLIKSITHFQIPLTIVLLLTLKMVQVRDN